MSFHCIANLKVPGKLSGPGYARKIGMDEAVRRFHQIDNQNGIIVSLDADSLVQENYFTSIWEFWNQHKKVNGVSIQFEHPLDGDMDEKIYHGIINYELHLRYYINAQRFCLFPYAYQTIGSCFAVSASAYAKQGGMNKRKAGDQTSLAFL